MKYQYFEKQVRSILPVSSNVFISNGSGNPQFNISNISNEIKSSVSFFVKLFTDKNVFAIWDYQRHIEYNGGKSMLTILGSGKSWDGIITSSEVFTPYYHELVKPFSDKWEKVYVVGVLHLRTFFEHYEEYMEFNDNDKGFPSSLKSIVSPRLPRFIREKYSSERFNRDWHFRNSVLEAYDRQCAICRCKIPEVLQAAHEHGFEPGHSNWDDPEHGICLCANHHLMYDKSLIDIDLRLGTLRVLDDRVFNMKWYREFCDEFDMKLVKNKLTHNRQV